MMDQDKEKKERNVVLVPTKMVNESKNISASSSVDEISLVDLWIILVERKNLLFLLLGAFFIGAIILSLLLPTKYLYSTSIEMGGRIVNDILWPIDTPETLLAKVQDSYIPVVLQQYQKSNPSNFAGYSIDASLPIRSEVIVLKSWGTEEQGQVYVELHQKVIDEIKKDHKRLLDVVRAGLEIKRNEARNVFEELHDTELLLKAKEKRLSDTEGTLKAQIENAKKQLAAVEKNRLHMVSQAKNDLKTMTLLVFDNTIQNQQQRLADMEQKLVFDLANDKEKVAKELLTNSREQRDQNEKIAKIESQLKNMMGTKAVVPPTRSIKPSSLSKFSIILVTTIFGLIISVFVVFSSEFLQRARTEMRRKKSAIDSRTHQ